MELKKVNPLSKNRTELLGFLQRLGISTSTKLKIGVHIFVVYTG